MSCGIGSGKTVCVTGASGFIASWLVKLLLQRGYTVKASVRDLNNPKKTDHLHELPGAEDRLHLFKADLLDGGAFDSIVDGCDGVFHTASPCLFDVDDPQSEMIDPAVTGTLNVLSSCAKTPSVKRVILTSTMGTVLRNKRPRNPEAVIDETWFSNLELCKESKLWYAVSKILAEEAAWKYAKDHEIDMITLHPAVVTGPLLQPTLNSSSEIVLNFIKGAHTYSNTTVGYVDVRDVANAHILAFEVPSASGRYCLAESVAHFSEVVKILRKLFPDIQLPDKCADDNPLPPRYQISKEKAKTLGVEFIPLEVSLKETVESLKKKKFISF